MENQPKQILIYKTSEGKVPFEEWLNKLKDGKTRAKIKTRLTRVTLGNLGDYKSVGEGVCELRINYGKGYRIYFAQQGSIYTFVALIFVYVARMNALDKKYNVHED